MIIFGIPVVQILLFGYVITNEIKDVRIAVFDKSRDNVTVKLINKLTSSGYFIIRGEIYRKEEIDTYFKHGIVKEVVVFEPDFAEKLRRSEEPEIQIICDASDPNTARLLSNYTRAVIHDFVMDINSGTDQIFGIIPIIRMLYNPELKGVFMFVPGVMALLLTLISAMITSISITREKELGTMEMHLVSPFRPFHIVFGKVVPYVVISFINT
ncbi:MAG: ABC transporter permease, partial [bacterium]